MKNIKIRNSRANEIRYNEQMIWTRALTRFQIVATDSTDQPVKDEFFNEV